MNCFSCWSGSPKPIPAINGERDYDHTTSSRLVFPNKGHEDESTNFDRQDGLTNPLSSCPRTNGMDLISDLPDDILIKIMSSFSTKDVIKTSALCSKWINIWKGVHNVQINYGDILHFLDGHSPPDWIIDMKLWTATERVLKLLSAFNSTKVSKLEITEISNFTLHSHDLVDSVAQFCLDHHVEDLALDFDFPEWKFLTLDASCEVVLQIGTFLPIRSLNSLSVNGCKIQLSSLERSLYPSFLKTLVLSKVATTREEIEDLLSKCPSLTSLFLHSCKLARATNILAINHSKLRSLVIQVYAPIKFKTPVLKSLEFPDLLYWWRDFPRGHIFEDVSSVTKCKFQFSKEFGQIHIELLWRSLYRLRHAKTIQLDHNCVKGLPLSAPPTRTLAALTTRKLKLSLIDAGNDVGPIASALTFFSRIEKLTMFMEENCCLLHSRKYWWSRIYGNWRLLKQSLRGMEQLKEVSLHNFFRVIDERPHINKEWKSAFKEELKMIRIMMQSIKNLEKLTIHVSRDIVMKRAPTSFISTLLNRFDRIRDLPRASPIATLDIIYA